jgi:hypothetical protein
MVFGEFTYAVIFGRPVLFWLGTITISFLIVTAVLGLMTLRGKVKFKWHKRMAIITIIWALIHGILAMLGYF